jgi:hypothetical protein
MRVRQLRAANKTKKGATVAPFLAGEAAYRFLPPFFFPPVFLAIALIPPFTRGIRSRGLVSVMQRRCLPARRPAVGGAPRFVAHFRVMRKLLQLSKKLGVSCDTPSGQESA